MLKRTNRITDRSSRALALVVAVLLLAAGSLATAHFHVTDFRHGYGQAEAISETFCPLCLFHFHSPTNPGTPPPVIQPAAVHRYTPADPGMRRFVAWSSILFSRAPPVSI